MIRNAMDADNAALVRMGSAFVLEAYGETLDADSFLATIESMREPEKGVVLVVERNGVVCGAAGAILAPKWTNPAILLGVEMFWWLDPPARTGITGVRLFNALECWMLNANAKPVMCATGKLKPEALERFYQRRGYHRVESHYERT